MVVSNCFCFFYFFSLFFFILFFSSYIYLFFFVFVLFLIYYIIIIIIVYIFVNFGWLNYLFIYLLFILLYFYAWILNSRIDDFIIYICLVFLFVCRKGFEYALSSVHTHCVHDMSEALYLGVSNFRIKGDCVTLSQWMYFPSGHCENPS